MIESTQLTVEQQKEIDNKWLALTHMPQIVFQRADGPCNFKMELQFNDSAATQETQDIRKVQVLQKMTGASSWEYGYHLTSKLTAVSNSKNLKYMEQVANAHKMALLALKPQDEIEGMLITRMLPLHDKIMELMAVAFHVETSAKASEYYINSIAKLTRLYNETLDALNKHRRKGEQKVIVQHVNVGTGGQAIVGTVHQGGGGEHKN